MRHEEQRDIWEKEHQNPTVLKQMDSSEVSSGVRKFWDFLVSENLPRQRGIEMGCGKGRNAIWLAQQGAEMSAFDFSSAAIKEAKQRAMSADRVSFQVADATEPWLYESDSFDFGIDCFASTDIGSPAGRQFAISEMARVLRSGGLLLAYLLSVDDEFHKQMIQKSPAGERNAFLHPNGKFEKVYDEEDIAALFDDWKIVRKERVPKTADFGGREYACNHFWLVMRRT